ncbi:Putative oxidoreductase [Planctomycetes bacterium Poly30]|uniref:Oxidoreductase n=1 Tax=Saltatorellus ferox TaxID=2528018 RepID=A0A518EP71_9BACT|nr:Putative oxidoreductase [Planctomycetes bacterium Poly30]
MIQRTYDYDVLIAGAGPGGTHTALRLAKRGYRVAIFDKRTFPRKKPCGEFMSPECLPLLDEIGLKETVLDHGASRVSGMRLHGFGQAARGNYTRIGELRLPSGFGVALRREVLDTLTVEAAKAHENIDVFEGWSVSGPTFDEAGRVHGLRLRDPQHGAREFRSRFVIGADGLRSRVAQGMGWSSADPKLDRWAAVARFRGVERQAEAEVHFLDGAYFAAAPIDDGLFTINLVVNRGAIPGGAANLPRFFDEHVQAAPVLAQRLAGATLEGKIEVCGPLATRTTRRTAPGVALVGDACGFVDPLTGEGLFFAMRGAALLAEAVHMALENPQHEARALRGYERARRREFGPRYAMARLLQKGIRSPRVIESVLRSFSRRPGLTNLIVAWTGDYVQPIDLLRPSVWRSALRRRELIQADA